MIKYEEVSEVIYLLRRNPVIVIYHGTKTLQERIALEKLKGFVFISDTYNFLNYLPGMLCCGLIIEPDVETSDNNIDFALSRLEIDNDELIFHMDHTHKEQIKRILDECTSLDQFNYVYKLKKAIGIYPLVELYVEDK